MKTQHIKVRGTSRGVRLWIEGDRLSSAFAPTKRFNRTIEDGVITLTADAEGKYKVTNKKGAPAIDISAKFILGFPCGSDVLVTFDETTITYTTRFVY